jgi:DNA mismatch repair protein MutS
VIFLHRIVEGGADRSYGIHVARLAGVPRPVLERARQLLGELAVHHASRPRLGRGRRLDDVAQMDLFADPAARIAQELTALSVDPLTPQEALDLLRQWKQSMG